MYVVDNVMAIYHCKSGFIKLTIIATSRCFSTKCPYKHSKPYLPGSECVFVFNVPPTAKVIWRLRPRLNVSSDRLVKPGNQPAIPGLQGKLFIHNATAAPIYPKQTDRIGSVGSGLTLIESILSTEIKLTCAFKMCDAFDTYLYIFKFR